MKASGIEQNVRRENKLYSYAEQMAELELRKVSGVTGELFFGEVGFEGVGGWVGEGGHARGSFPFSSLFSESVLASSLTIALI